MLNKTILENTQLYNKKIQSAIFCPRKKPVGLKETLGHPVGALACGAARRVYCFKEETRMSPFPRPVFGLVFCLGFFCRFCFLSHRPAAISSAIPPPPTLPSPLFCTTWKGKTCFWKRCGFPHLFSVGYFFLKMFLWSFAAGAKKPSENLAVWFFPIVAKKNSKNLVVGVFCLCLLRNLQKF